MRVRRPLSRGLVALLLMATFALAQEHQHDAHSDMSAHEGMKMPEMNHGDRMNKAGMYLMNLSSGTSLNPQSWPMPMLMPRIRSWNLMLMGQAFLVETQQSGPRG